MDQKKEITATPASYYTSSLTPIVLEEGKHVQVSFEGMQVDNRGNLNKNIRGKLVIKKNLDVVGVLKEYVFRRFQRHAIFGF